MGINLTDVSICGHEGKSELKSRIAMQQQTTPKSREAAAKLLRSGQFPRLPKETAQGNWK